MIVCVKVFCVFFFFFFLMIRRPPRSTPLYSSAASDVYKRQSQYDVRKTAFPEAESLFNAMAYVHGEQFEPVDVHGRNVMVRQGTNELVLSLIHISEPTRPY